MGFKISAKLVFCSVSLHKSYLLIIDSHMEVYFSILDFCENKKHTSFFLKSSKLINLGEKRKLSYFLDDSTTKNNNMPLMSESGFNRFYFFN